MKKKDKKGLTLILLLKNHYRDCSVMVFYLCQRFYKREEIVKRNLKLLQKIGHRCIYTPVLTKEGKHTEHTKINDKPIRLHHKSL